MTVLSGHSTHALVRADGVELIGEMVGSGYRQPPALVRRADGQTLQLTPLLYQVLEAIDGRRDAKGVAARVTGQLGRTVTAANVDTLVDSQLRPLGLLVKPDGSQPEVKKANPLLGLKFKYAVTDPERTRRITAPFAALFNPFLVVVVLCGFTAVSWWVFMRKGLASATHEAFEKPGLLLLVIAVTVVSAGFHEFGHAAAARRGGATPGVMGAGVYLVWPAFYTDVTDSYRLGRWGRVRTDLGGLYFNAIVAVAIAGAWWLTRYDALLLVVATQILQMVRQLTPLVRFDGYHVLADLTGVPDLFQRIKPTLLGVLPWRWKHPETLVLKPWARAVVTLWVLAVVPLLVLALLVMVLTLPRLLGTAWASVREQSSQLGAAWGQAEVLDVAARAVAIIAVTFPILAVAVILVRLVRSVSGSVWTRTRGRPVRRGTAVVLAAGMVAGLAWAWWPRAESYRPIQPWEGGTMGQLVSAAMPSTEPAGLVPGTRGEVVTAWPEGDPMPTEEAPQLALVLVPRLDEGDGDLAVGDTAATTTTPAGPEDTDLDTAGTAVHPWVFSFDEPLQPDEGDNQALAVATEDDTVTYDVAFALVWVEDDSPALNTNEAYAFASCSDCAAVAIGFQVVLVTGDNHVAVPQNLAAAVNEDCVNCLTYALARQLFVTLDGPLSAEGMEQLAQVWAEVAEFAERITEVPLGEIESTLTAFESRILQIIDAEQDLPSLEPGTTSGPSSTPTGTPSEAPTSDPTTSDPATTDSPTSEPTSSSSGTPSATGSPTSSTSPTASTSSTPSPSASPTPSASPSASSTPSPSGTP